jgi:opacity protein-like surface antigen
LSAAFVFATGVTLVPRTSHAYTIETVVTRGCHEEITADVLRATQLAFPSQIVPLPSIGDDRALIDDVAFTVPPDLNEIGAVTLLLGVRDNDVKSFAAVAVDQLAALNSDPASQKLHCLRTGAEDEPSGSSAAVDDCRAYIRETLLSALDGLDAQGRPDGTKRDQLEVTLAIRGQIGVEVPTFYLRAGRALHAIEDSFTHTFRAVSDRHKVTVVLNWIDYADNNLVESRDGPAHVSELDRCDDPDALRKERRLLAIEAGTAALTALLAPGAPEAKAQAVDAVLDKYISFDTTSQCSAANHWCDAPENAYANTGCGCSLAGSGARPEYWALLLLALGCVVGLVARRRRRDRSLAGASDHGPAPFGSSTRRAAWGVLLGLVLVVAPRAARADEPREANGPGQKGPMKALEGKSKSGAPNTEDPAGSFFGRVAFGASYDKPGFAGGAGLRYELSRSWMLGFDAEWNPFVATSPTRVRAGAFNTYLSAIRRFQLKSDAVNMRTSAAIGTSVLLFDLVGAPAGSVGPFFGLSFLGVEWKMSPGFYLTVDPTYIAFPVPHLTGVPFGYFQYRFLLGVEFGG